MSAYMLKPERIAVIADYIATLHNAGYDYFGHSIPESLHHELLDCRDNYGFMITAKVFDRLSDLNMRAVCGRYDREPFIYGDIPAYKWICKHIELENDHDTKSWLSKIEPWHYELLKLIKCFLYQCNEDSTADDPLYKALRELERTLTTFIVVNNPAYVKAEWG